MYLYKFKYILCQTMLDIWNLKIKIYFILNIIIHLMNLVFILSYLNKVILLLVICHCVFYELNNIGYLFMLAYFNCFFI